MSKAQKLLVNLIYYKIKGFDNINVDVDSMFKHFNINLFNTKHDNNYGEYSSKTSNNINIFSSST